ncbi:MAG: ABC transporter permease [Nitrososphaerales archaeon]
MPSALLVSMRRTPLFVIGAAILGVIILASLFAPWLAQRDPLHQSLADRLKPPVFVDGASEYLFGSDHLGRDIFSRILYGIRVSLILGVLAVFISGLIGVSLGLISGYYGGVLDHIIMRVTDIMLSIPVILLAIAVIAVLGVGFTNLVLVIGFTQWMVYARTVRGETLSLKEKEFVEAARALGVGDLGILFRCIFLNALPTIIVVATLNVATVIVLEAGLSFLGLGIQPPTPSLGYMLAEGRLYLEKAWWYATLPGLVLMLIVLAINMMGDGLRDILDPYRRQVYARA